MLPPSSLLHSCVCTSLVISFDIRKKRLLFVAPSHGKIRFGSVRCRNSVQCRNSVRFGRKILKIRFGSVRWKKSRFGRFLLPSIPYRRPNPPKGLPQPARDLYLPNGLRSRSRHPSRSPSAVLVSLSDWPSCVGSPKGVHAHGNRSYQIKSTSYC